MARKPLIPRDLMAYAYLAQAQGYSLDCLGMAGRTAALTYVNAAGDRVTVTIQRGERAQTEIFDLAQVRAAAQEATNV